jgi:hypothetical protein
MLEFLILISGPGYGSLPRSRKPVPIIGASRCRSRPTRESIAKRETKTTVAVSVVLAGLCSEGVSSLDLLYSLSPEAKPGIIVAGVRPGRSSRWKLGPVAATVVPERLLSLGSEEPRCHRSPRPSLISLVTVSSLAAARRWLSCRVPSSSESAEFLASSPKFVVGGLSKVRFQVVLVVLRSSCCHR